MGRLSPYRSAFLADRALSPIVFGPVLECAFEVSDFILRALLIQLSPHAYALSLATDRFQLAEQPDPASGLGCPDGRRFRAGAALRRASASAIIRSMRSISSSLMDRL